MHLEQKRWWPWQRTDFFNDRVQIRVVARGLRDTVVPVFSAEASIIDEYSRRKILTFPPSLGSITFEFWAGDNKGGAHEPKFRIHSDVPNQPTYEWFAIGRVFRKKSRQAGAEYWFPSVSDIHF